MNLIDRQAAIDIEGIDEQIKCEMCINPMHTDRGCDGCCEYDKKLYEKIMQILDERIKPSSSAQSEIIRCKDCIHNSLNQKCGNVYCNLGIGLYQLDDYCSYGERRKTNGI